MPKRKADAPVNVRPVELVVNDEPRAVVESVESKESDPIMDTELDNLIPPSKRVKREGEPEEKKALSEAQINQRKNAAKSKSVKAKKARDDRLQRKKEEENKRKAQDRKVLEDFYNATQVAKEEASKMRDELTRIHSYLETVEEERKRKADEKALKQEHRAKMEEERRQKDQEDEEARLKRDTFKREYELNQWRKKQAEEEDRILHAKMREEQLQPPNWDDFQPQKKFTIPPTNTQRFSGIRRS